MIKIAIVDVYHVIAFRMAECDWRVYEKDLGYFLSIESANKAVQSYSDFCKDPKITTEKAFRVGNRAFVFNLMCFVNLKK